jgi:RNA polymerase sigma-70 factor (ECF subfamily)
MARTTVLDMQRNLSRRSEHEVSLTVENNEGEQVTMDVADTDGQNDPVVHFERTERIAAVRKAMEQLPTEQREIICLKDMQGLSYAQITAVLGIEEGTVGSRLNRARKNLKKILEAGKIY